MLSCGCFIRRNRHVEVGLKESDVVDDDFYLSFFGTSHELGQFMPFNAKQVFSFRCRRAEDSLLQEQVIQMATKERCEANAPDWRDSVPRTC